MYGNPCNIAKLKDLSSKYNIYLIEDAAQAHGAIYQDVPIGAHSDVVCWSFYPGKNLGAHGDAGAITTNSLDVYLKALEIRNYGSTQKYVIIALALIREWTLCRHLYCLSSKSLPDAIAHRSLVADTYCSFLDGIGDLVLDKAECSASRHARQFVIQTGSRDLLSSFLKEHGIGTLIHYPCPPFKQNAYKSRFLDKSYPKAELVASSVLSLPIGIHINEESIEYISDKIIQFFGGISINTCPEYIQLEYIFLFL